MVTARTCRCAHVKSRVFICVYARALSPSFSQGCTRAAAGRSFCGFLCSFLLLVRSQDSSSEAGSEIGRNLQN